MTTGKMDLRRAVRDIVALSALPAVWMGYRFQEIVDDLAEVLLRVAGLDFTYIRLTDDADSIVAVRSKQATDDGYPLIRSAVERLLDSPDAVGVRAAENAAGRAGLAPVLLPDPLGSNRFLRAVVIGDEPDEIIVAASSEPEFPTEIDRLLLTFGLNQVRIVLGRRCIQELREENVCLRDEIDERLMMGSVIGVSRAIRKVLSDVDKVAPTDATVLITGETGTGKELIAREVHRRSRRAGGPMIAVHSASLPATLIASELFGHERGAFTGAVQRRIGRFELASKGTIFLDEVGELPPEMQISLLRVLQERTYERVGGTQTLHTDARVIAATNRDLLKMVSEGTFREDLYYRLSVFPIHIPPLRERRQDIPPLIEYFAALFAKRLGRKITRVSKASMDRLLAYSWPGNVRELENVIERAVILARGDELIIGPAFFPRQPNASGRGSLPMRLDEMEKSTIEQALIESGGRVGGPLGAAARLGLRPTTLYSKLRKYQIEPARFKASR